MKLFVLFSALIVAAIWTQHVDGAEISREKRATSALAVTINFLNQKIESVIKWLSRQSEVMTFDYIYRVNSYSGVRLFEGDIKLQRSTRNAITNQQQLWQTKSIAYVIEGQFDAAGRQYIAEAIDEYRTKTCLRFVPRTTETDYIRFTDGRACYSMIGYVGGAQEIVMHPGCLRTGTVIHEMMHALGFWHEQSRTDRDSWVQIVFENIKPGKAPNFEKQQPANADTLGTQYDYGSIMHYSKFAFSRNGNPTLLPTRDPSAAVGQRKGLSSSDALRINKLYQCGGISQQTAAPTEAPTTETTTRRTFPTPPPTTTSTTTTTTAPTTQSTARTTKRQLIRTPAPTTRTTTRSTTTRSTTRRLTFPTPPPTTRSTTTTTTTTTTTPRAIQTTTIPPSLGWSRWSEWSACSLLCQRQKTRFCLQSNGQHCSGSNVEIGTCPWPCKPVSAMGCWLSSATTLPIPSAEGHDPTLLPGSYKGRENEIRRCADYAATRGYQAFGIFDTGMCLTGPRAQITFNSQGPAKDCGSDGLGTPESMNAYSLNADVNGQWSVFSDWGQCTQSCGGGRQYRWRWCNNPAPVGNGLRCTGGNREARWCNTDACPEIPSCGTRHHSGSSGMITLNGYTNQLECTWLLSSNLQNSVINLEFKRIDIESSPGCAYDALMVFDGPSTWSNLVDSYCGDISPTNLTSSGGNLLIKFSTDETRTASGFEITWSAKQQPGKSCSLPPTPTHGSMQGTGVTIGSTYSFGCNPGYEIIGSSSVTCVDHPGAYGVWSDVYPWCVPQMFSRFRKSYRRFDRCTFENTMCGFTQDTRDDFNWQLAPGNRLVAKNGPVAIRETGEYVMLAEASRARITGDRSLLTGREIQPHHMGHCLRFSYFTGGVDMGELNVYTTDHTMTTTIAPVWTRDYEEGEGPAWREAQVYLSNERKFKVVFEAVIGDGLDGDIAFDDVTVTKGLCPEREPQVERQ